MTRSHDEVKKWRMFCDNDRCSTRSESFDREPPLSLFAERGWFIAKLFGDLCPTCLADGVKPTAEPHSLKFRGAKP